LREDKVHIHGSPVVPSAPTHIYFDIEGLPERDFFYLIGMLAVSEDGSKHHHSFWADNENQQHDIFARFILTQARYKHYRLFHFGEYEAAALRRMKSRLPKEYQQAITDLLGRSVNVLSIIHAHIYFPTWSNGLKDIATYLGYKWSDTEANGLQSIVWREQWEGSNAANLKDRLIKYNLDDCMALKRVTDFVASTMEAESETSRDAGPSVVRTTRMQATPNGRSHRFKKIEYVLPELNEVNQCAYFDYQREKVFVRTDKQFRRINRRKAACKRRRAKPNKVIEITSKKCQRCRSGKLSPKYLLRREVIDIRFFKGGVKKWITQYLSHQYKCRKCEETFVPDGVPDAKTKYGLGLMSWCVYHNVVVGQNILKIRRAVADVFDLHVPQPSMYRFKVAVAERLRPMSEEFMAELLRGPILHIDETEVRLRDRKGYVWVFANLDTVYFTYRESREAQFVGELLREFSGILISDFFTGYDSIDCPQQKCLIHLLRDMNDDLLSNPFDDEYKNLMQQFANVLRSIVETIDKYGLKRRHLNKHVRKASGFVGSVTNAEFSSIVAKKYQKRITKYRQRLFTFLSHDGVPWNNNNAEHAVKSFAKHRRFADGRFTEKSINDYLVILSVFQTCEYRNIDVLKFLLSGRTTVPK